MSHRIDPASWTTLFTEARSQNGWLDKPVGESLLQELYEITRMGPTSMNCQPASFVILKTDEAKARLLPALMPGNVEQTRTAPVDRKRVETGMSESVRGAFGVGSTM